MGLQGTIEEKIFQRQVSKQGLSSVVQEKSTADLTEFSLADLKVQSFNFTQKICCSR